MYRCASVHVCTIAYREGGGVNYLSVNMEDIHCTYKCAYIYIYVCMHTCMYVCMHVCIVCTYMYACTYVSMEYIVSDVCAGDVCNV